MSNKKQRSRKLAEDRLEELHGEGRLTPTDVVEDAVDPESPLHRFFTWDDEKAAQERRLTQARELIRSVRVFSSVEERLLDAPRYVHDPREMGQAYVELASLKDDAARAREVVQAELARVIGALRRANAVADVLGLTDEMGALIKGTTVLAAAVADEDGDAAQE